MSNRRDEITKDIAETSNAFRFAAAVTAFAQQLGGGINTAEFDYSDIARLAQQAREEDLFGYSGEFLSMVNMASSISQPEKLVQVTQ